MHEYVALYDLRGLPDETLLERLVQSGFRARRSTRTDDGSIWTQGAAPRCIVVRPGDAGEVEALSAMGLPLVAVCPDDERLVVASLEAGADSVVVEPVSRRELEARIRALLRPTREPGPAGGTYRIGRITIDTEGHSVTGDGRRVPLTPMEFDVLCCLARRAGQAVSPEEIAGDVWGSAEGARARSLGFHVRGLRRKLAGVARLVHTRGAGYRLACGGPGEGVDDGYGGIDQAFSIGYARTRGGLRAKRPLAPVGQAWPDPGRPRRVGGRRPGAATAAAGAAGLRRARA